MSRHDRTRRSSGVTAKALVEAAKAIGHPARLRILAMLQVRPMCVCQMTAVLDLAPSTVSGHLNDLRRSRLVVEDRQGKLVYYTLDAHGPCHDLVRRSVALVAEDDRIAADRLLMDRVQALPIDIVTSVGFRLPGLGRRVTPRAASATPTRAGRVEATTRPRG